MGSSSHIVKAAANTCLDVTNSRNAQKQEPHDWISARLGQQRGVGQAYRNLDSVPAVPAFVISANNILRRLKNEYARSNLAAAKKVPLEARISKKRMADSSSLEFAPPLKRSKPNDSFQYRQTLAPNATLHLQWSPSSTGQTNRNSRIINSKKPNKQRAAQFVAQREVH